MLKKDDRHEDLDPIPTNGKNRLEDIFKKHIKEDVNDNVTDNVTDNMTRLLCNTCDYVKEILCMAIAIIMEDEDFRVVIKESQKEDNLDVAYFSKTENKIILNKNESEEFMYIALIDQFIYKLLVKIELNDNEKRDIMNILDQMKDTTKSFYEELTQREIKMLEWLDKKMVNWIQSLDDYSDKYVTELDDVDYSTVNLVEVYLMWGRNLERLEIVSQILNPFTDYLQNIIFTKIEDFIIKNGGLERLDISEYLRIKLNTIKLLNEENVAYKKKIEVLKGVRLLDMPLQTDKTLNVFRKYFERMKDGDDVFDEIEKEKSIYRYSILQREYELTFIEKKRRELSKDMAKNKETIMQLSNLKDIIEGEERELKRSLKIIDEKINLLKGAGA